MASAYVGDLYSVFHVGDVAKGKVVKMVPDAKIAEARGLALISRPKINYRKYSPARQNLVNQLASLISIIRRNNQTRNSTVWW